MADLDQSRTEVAELQTFVQELTELVHEAVKEMERLLMRVEQQTSLRDSSKELPLIISRLSELRVRVQRRSRHAEPARGTS